MDLRGLNIFIQVAEQGSFTRAGELLGYSQPTISFQIRQLEQELGVPLFDRVGHTVSLTDAGRQALAYAQRICNLSREMISDARDTGPVRGHLRLGMADSLCQSIIAEGFDEFRSRYPELTLTIFSAGTGELLRMLDHNEVDIVCTLDSHVYDSAYVIAAEEPIGVHFVAGAADPLASRETIAPEELPGLPFMLTERGMSYRRLMDEQLAARSLEVRPVLEAGQTAILCRLVEKGLGISFLPDYVTEAARRRGTVVPLPVTGIRADVWRQVLYRREKWVSPQMKVVLDYLSSLKLQ